MVNKCQECNCPCARCSANDHDVHLHLEIEHLKEKLLERENHIVTMETNFLNEANKYPNGEVMALREELITWQDKYRRLYEGHRRVQRVNQGLEDKLLKLVDVCETDKSTLTKDVATLSQKLAEANYTIKKLSLDNDRYKKDVSLAIQFLQCKQSNFVAHKFDSLPQEVQGEVSIYMTRKPEEKKSEMKSIKVPMPTFPPTAMVYSVPKQPNIPVTEPPVDIVSAAIMAKVLEERQKEKEVKHCDTCTCSKQVKIVTDVSSYTVGTQTGDYKTGVCLRCNEALEGQKYRLASPEDGGNNVVKVQPNNCLLDKGAKVIHHRLCSQKSFDSESSAKVAEKGPRYCSMRVQNTNILLDNAHNIAPVLYKRQNKGKETPTTHLESESCSSEDVKNISIISDSSNQQRVADWIQNNLDNNNPETEDRTKYAEMEENVKRFLFGQSEFLKTVEIGKMKYQKCDNSKTETQI